MNRYRKKPVEIEAVQWTGDNVDEMAAFIEADWTHYQGLLCVPTLEGDMTARPDDWIIRGVAGEFYPCNPDIFAATYEPVSNR